MEEHAASNEPKWFKCSKCECRSLYQSALWRHKVMAHLLTQPEESAKVKNSVILVNKDFTVYVNQHRVPGTLYKCKKCPYFTKSLLSLRIHMRRHNTQQNKFYCQKNSTAEIQSYLSKWLSRNVTTNRKKEITEVALRQYTCKNCPFQTSSPLLSLRHRKLGCPKTKSDEVYKIVKKIEWFYCSQCIFKSNSERKLHIHELKSHPKTKRARKKVQNWMRCAKCSFQTLDPWLLGDHINEEHTTPDQIKWFNCTQCDFTTKYKISYYKHKIVRHKTVSEVQLSPVLHCTQSVLHCTQCTFQTTQESRLKHHIQRHNEKWFQCSECHFRRESASLVWKHKVMAHIVKKSRQIFFRKNGFDCTKSILEIYHCNYCRFKTALLPCFKEHVDGHTQNNRSTFTATLYKCEDCSFQTNSKLVLLKHLKRERHRMNVYENGLGVNNANHPKLSILATYLTKVSNRNLIQLIRN